MRLLECTNPMRDKWRVRWDVQTHEDGSADWMEAEFAHKPTDDEIRETVIGWCNSETDKAILSGFAYDGVPVWLSQENQMNYKTAYDLAVQTEGATLPVRFKFGTDTEPVYREFTTLEELTDFYTAAITHIRKTLEEGWQRKDAFSLENYRMT